MKLYKTPQISFLSLTLFLSAALATPSTELPQGQLKISAGEKTLEIEVRNSELLERLQKHLGQPAKIPFTPVVESSKGKSHYDTLERKELMATLVADLKDLVDEIALSKDAESFSALDSQTQNNIFLLTSLREQIALNWAEEHILTLKIKKTTLRKVEKLLGVEISLLISNKDLQKHFCHPQAKIKISDCP